MKNEAVVYKITCLENGRIYIGATIDFKRRMQQHSKKAPVKMKEDLEKYGWDGFKKEIIYSGSKEDCFNVKEIELIEKLNPEYNSMAGGVGTGSYGCEVYGEDNWNSVLTDELVISIREEYALGNIKQSELATKYNISATAISKVTRGASWVKADGPITSNRISEKHVVEIREKYFNKLYETSVLAAEYDISSDAIRNLLIGKTWQDIEGPTGKIRKGTKTADAKKIISEKKLKKEKEIIEIREEYALGKISQAKLAKKYGLTCISKIINGFVYTNIGGPIKGKDY